MNRFPAICFTAFTALAACASPQVSGRPPVPPPVGLPGIAPSAGAPMATHDDAATQAWLRQEIDRQVVHPANRPASQPAAEQPAPQDPPPRQPGVNPTDEDATNRWLEAERARVDAVNPERPPEPVYQVVERPVYVDRTVYVERPYWRRGYVGYGYDACGQPVYHTYDCYDSYPVYRRPVRETAFPVNTLLGAGLGAVIGHQSGRRDRGAAIGAGLGLLFDLGRWHR